MAVSYKSVLPMGVPASRRARLWAVHRLLPPRRRRHRSKPEAIPGTAAAYIWLAVALGLSAGTLALALGLAGRLLWGWAHR